MGAFGSQVAPVIATFGSALLRDSPPHHGTEVDRYVRREYGGPSAAWLLSLDNGRPSANPTPESMAGERFLRRVTQAIAAFF